MTLRPRFALSAALLLASTLAASACTAPIPDPDDITARPRLSLDDAGRKWVDRTLDGMDLDSRVAQLFAVRVLGEFRPEDDAEWATMVGQVRDMGIGGVIFFQGSPVEQAALANELQSLADVPLLISQDMEWGPGMRLPGATRFPTPMAMAAAGDLDLAYRAGLATAREARSVGVRQIFAPVADVNTSPANPVIDTRSFSDRPEIVGPFVAAFVRGVQAGGVHATIKHFPGHGSTDGDSHDALPVTHLSAGALDSLHLPPFREAIAAGVSSVMTAHVAYPDVDSGFVRPATLSPALIHVLLRDSLGFDGLIVTDALSMGAIRDGRSPGDAAVEALEAGVDMLLMSEDTEIAHRAVVTAVREGRLDEERIARSVRRVLTAKAAAGLHIGAMTNLDHVRDRVGGDRARALADRIAARSLTMLEGELPVLSGRPDERILVVTISDRPGSTPDHAFRQALRRSVPYSDLRFLSVDPTSVERMQSVIGRHSADADRVVVALFAFAGRWKKQPRTAASLAGLVDGLGAGDTPATVVLFGTPYMLSDLPRLPSSLLVAYDPGEASQRAAAGALAGAVPVWGRLPVDVPTTYAFGSGRSFPARYPRFGVPEEAGMDGNDLARIDSLVRGAIDRHAFPGAAVAVGRGDVVTHLAGYGFHTYQSTLTVSETSTFDMASVTKVVATTTAMMLLYEEGLVDLDAPVARYVPEFGRNGKEAVTVRQLLSHTGGLIPYRAFHRLGITTRRGVMESIYDESLVYEPGAESRYSDFGPIILAELVERVSGVPFEQYVRENVFEPLGMWRTGYHRAGAFDPESVPTEVDDYFRNRTLQGEVHDETAWILGGVAGHAGLFSTAFDLTRFASMMVNEGRVGDTQFLDPGTIRLFTTPVDSTGSHTRALGWDTRSPEGYTSAGQYFGPRSYGHTGFTGTSLWIDPDARLYVLLLANRVYPTRQNQKHTAVRSALADLVFGAVRTATGDPLLPSLAD